MEKPEKSFLLAFWPAHGFLLWHEVTVGCESSSQGSNTAGMGLVELRGGRRSRGLDRAEVWGTQSCCCRGCRVVARKERAAQQRGPPHFPLPPLGPSHSWGSAGRTLEPRLFRAGLGERVGLRCLRAWPVEPQNSADSGPGRASPGTGFLPRSLPFKRCRRGGAAVRAPG